MDTGFRIRVRRRHHRRGRRRLVGFTIGAGVEAAVTGNVTIKAEYLYADFGDADLDCGVDIGLTSHIVRVWLKHKF